MLFQPAEMKIFSVLLLVATFCCFHGCADAFVNNFMCFHFRRFCPTNKSKCYDICTKEYVPVCGEYPSSGVMKTFSNKCLLEVAQCEAEQSGKTLNHLHDGKCKYTSKECPEFCTEQYEPVCGSDRVTYGNSCKFEIAACNAMKQGKEIWTIIYYGRCTV